MKMFEYSMSVKDITYCLQINTEGLRVKFYTDMRLYDSILFHLLSNAVKFSPTGSVITIEIDLQAVEDAQSRMQRSEIIGIIVTKISDQGPGM